MKAQIAALANASQANRNDKEEDPMVFFSAHSSTLEDIPSSTIDGSGADSLYSTLPRNTIGSVASMTFVRDEAIVRNRKNHVRPLLTAERKKSHSTKAGQLQVIGGKRPIYVSALVVTCFKDNLISVGQITKPHNVLFTNDGFYLIQKGEAIDIAKRIGGRGSDNLYTMFNDGDSGTLSLIATPARLKIPANFDLHSTLNLTNP